MENVQVERDYYLQWKDFGDHLIITTPADFSFSQCLVYLDRSDNECLHQVKKNELIKLVKLDGLKLLLKISEGLRVDFLESVPNEQVKLQVAKFVQDMFDLQTNLFPFYTLAENDEILEPLVQKYKGLRIIKINDLFECLTWAVIGQQINLTFAYTLKKRLVEVYGDKVSYEGDDYFTFPTPSTIAKLDVEDLKELQFTTRKAEYVIGIAKLFVSGELDKEKLSLEKEYATLLKQLVSIRGIGHWTADYTIMKSFNMNCAFPIADVGIHNALKGILGRVEKPTIAEIKQLAENWQGWESYAAFYLWRWLYD